MARIVGIDLGSHSVKVVRLEPRVRGSYEVIGFGEAAVPPPAEGEDAAATMPERLSVALAELKSRGHLDGEVFVTGLPGDAAAVRTIAFPFSDAKKIAEALPFAVESELPLDLDEIVLSWLILGPTAKARRDGTGETEVLVAWAKKEAVQHTLDLLAVHGIDPRHVEFDALALDDLYDGLFKPAEDREGPTELRTPGGTVIETGPDAAEPAVAVVDIGHRRTSVCVLAQGRVVGASTLLHGGADATRSLARAIGLPLAEAERGKKKEAFIEVAGARAQFPEQQQISDTLKSAYAPVVRRLRQIFQATMSSARVRVVKVYLTGGGSRVLNVDRHMAEELNVKVVRGRAIADALKGQIPIESIDGAPEAAVAFAYALSAVQGSRSRARIDFRTGEFAWKGDFDFLRERAPAFAAWAAALLLLFGASGVARALVLSSTEKELVAQELKLCKEIIGQDFDSYSVCKSMIDQKIAGTVGFAVPERSAADTYLEIARRLPPSSEVKRKVTELDITADRVKMRGLTSSYEAIDKMVEKLQGGRCFSLVEKGKAQGKGADIQFEITITLDCAAAPGDGKDPPPPPGPTASARAAPTYKPASLQPPEPAPSAPERPSYGTPQPPVVNESRSDPTGSATPRTGKLTPEEIEDRRERLKKLREEREARRAGRLGPDGMNPFQTGTRPPPALRDKMLKKREAAEGSDEEKE